MLRISAQEVCNLRGEAGQRITTLVDAVIRVQGASAKIPDSNIETNIRTTIPDGGVDTAVHDAIADEPTGRLCVPTAWQYKAQQYRDIRSVECLVSEKHVRKLIEAGHGFRLVVADEMPSKTKTAWEKTLLAECQAIQPNASPPMVITASDLSEWVNRFPALVMGFFHPELATRCQHLGGSS